MRGNLSNLPSSTWFPVGFCKLAESDDHRLRLKVRQTKTRTNVARNSYLRAIFVASCSFFTAKPGRESFGLLRTRKGMPVKKSSGRCFLAVVEAESRANTHTKGSLARFFFTFSSILLPQETIPASLTIRVQRPRGICIGDIFLSSSFFFFSSFISRTMPAIFHRVQRTTSFLLRAPPPKGSFLKKICKEISFTAGVIDSREMRLLETRKGECTSRVKG